MIGRVELFFRTIRRRLSRSELAVRLLKLSTSEAKVTEPGLIMIQIDGLSHGQLRRALDKGEMPFLKKLLRRDHYQLHTLYAGVPSTTPAIQAELFYGVKHAVPAFSFYHRPTGQVVRMFDPAPAAALEQELAKQGKPLLAGGSAYSDIFTGGAAESHFCPSSLGWGDVLQAANPFGLLFLLLTNLYSLLRIATLLVLELGLALVDFGSGLIKGHDLGKELKFIPTRVGICILLRELITIGVKMDIARGLPIIHLNLIGYDEQAHRRGPYSLFAHWALQGIDDAVARIWRAARRSARREYDVWIYSDHGQEPTISYAKLTGQGIETAVGRVLQNFLTEQARIPTADGHGEQAQRVRLLGGKRMQRLFPTFWGDVDSVTNIAPIITAMGPLGFIYLPVNLSSKELVRLARQLANEAGIPMVMLPESDNQVRLWTATGDEYLLPADRERVFGPYHPFLAEAARDLIALCHHAQAGELAICGWRKDVTPCSFSTENGAHGGPGPRETKGFALLPPDIQTAAPPRDYLVPMDLRDAAFTVLGQAPPRPTTRERRHVPLKTLRIMTYNVHSCIGMDGKIAPERIARVIAQHRPDVVALQELDVGRRRTARVDQAELIAKHLRMDFHFHAAMQVAEEQYGNAVLTHLPLRLIKRGPLPGLARKPGLEPRGALWVAIDLDGVEIQLVNTHLGLRAAERWQQIEALFSREWLNHPDCHRPVVLCGDFNAAPSSRVCLRIREFLRDAQIEFSDQARPRRTFLGRYPVARIDHVFVDPGIQVVGIEVPSTALARVASDHLPLIAELGLRP